MILLIQLYLAQNSWSEVPYWLSLAMTSALNFISVSQLLETNCAFPPGRIYFCSNLPIPVPVSLRRPAAPQAASTLEAPAFLTGSFLMQVAAWNHHDKSTKGDCQFSWALGHLAFLMHLRALIPQGMQSITVPGTTHQPVQWMAPCHATPMLAQCINMQIQNITYANIY